MRKWLLVGLVLAEVGCWSPTPTAPTPTPAAVPACQTNNTAEISFENRSNSNTTYYVLWDGSNLLTLAPGQKSDPRTVAAGVQHTLVFRISNTNSNACTPSTPTLPQCSSNTYSCTY